MWFVDNMSRVELAQGTYAGYTSGAALARVDDARTVVLVEGISDQVALETLAVRRGRDLDAEGILVLPMGGAQAIGRYLRQLGPKGMNLRLAGLCDAAEQDIFRRSLVKAGLGSSQTRVAMEQLGFFVCVDDLESELLHAIDPARVETIFAAQGDLAAFRTLQKQPAWAGRRVEEQMRRFLGSGARRKIRYARLLTEAVDLGRVPHPLDGVLAFV